MGADRDPANLKRRALRRLRWPAGFQIAAAASWGLGLIVGQVLSALGLVDGQGVHLNLGSENDALYDLAALGVAELYLLVVAGGGVAMWIGRAKPLAWIGAVLCCVPCCSPWVCIGIPLGVWSIVVLMNATSDDAFG